MLVYPAISLKCKYLSLQVVKRKINICLFLIFRFYSLSMGGKIKGQRYLCIF